MFMPIVHPRDHCDRLTLFHQLDPSGIGERSISLEIAGVGHFDNGLRLNLDRVRAYVPGAPFVGSFHRCRFGLTIDQQIDGRAGPRVIRGLKDQPVGRYQRCRLIRATGEPVVED